MTAEKSLNMCIVRDFSLLLLFKKKVWETQLSDSSEVIKKIREK